MTLQDILESFDVPSSELMRLQSARSIPEAQEVFDDLKKQAKVNWKKKAMELHPDRGGDIEEMKKLNALWNRVKGLRIIPHQRPVFQPAVVRVYVNYNTWGGTGTSTTTTTGSWW